MRTTFNRIREHPFASSQSLCHFQIEVIVRVSVTVNSHCQLCGVSCQVGQSEPSKLNQILGSQHMQEYGIDAFDRSTNRPSCGYGKPLSSLGSELNDRYQSIVTIIRLLSLWSTVYRKFG